MIFVPIRVATKTEDILAHPFDGQPLIEKTDILLHIRSTGKPEDSKTVTRQTVSRIQGGGELTWGLRGGKMQLQENTDLMVTTTTSSASARYWPK